MVAAIRSALFIGMVLSLIAATISGVGQHHWTEGIYWMLQSGFCIMIFTQLEKGIK